jgi:SAM-dependent methyltransferase
MRFSPPYSSYARIYDQIGQRAFGERMAGVILAELATYGAEPSTVLDLGCGTGSATMAFARAGLVTTGLDRSPDMLHRARSLACDAGLDISFVEADMIDSGLPDRFDLVTCIYDAVNYLSGNEELRKFFTSVYDLLESGGVFTFDMNTLQRLTTSWEQGLMLAGDSDDLYVTYRSWFDDELDASPLIVTAFMRESDGRWTRFDEEHVERAWLIADVVRWLTETGFSVRQVAGYIDSTGDLIRPAREDHGRVLFLATR